LDDVTHLIGASDESGGSGAVPLHHADVVGGAEDDGCAFGLVEEGGFFGEDLLSVLRLLNVLNAT
jgi:hypothetical protein